MNDGIEENNFHMQEYFHEYQYWWLFSVSILESFKKKESQLCVFDASLTYLE